MPAPSYDGRYPGPFVSAQYLYNNATDQWEPMTAVSGGGGSSMRVTTAGAGSAGTNRSATVATTAGQLMAANANRIRFFIKNDGANNIWVNLGGTAAAVAGSGNYRIASGGGFLEINGYTGAISAIAETASVNVSALEL